jgi:hypothetical protein
MPSGETGMILPASSPTPSQSSTARRATALAMARASASWVAPSGRASMAGSARADTISAVVSGADQQAQAGGEVQPFGRGGQVQSDHDQYPARVLTRTAVHMRAGLVALAACQSKLACTPCGPAISMRGIGR